MKPVRSANEQQAGHKPAWLLRLLLVAAGSLALSIGIVGLFLPLLPTTPLLLVAAACYLRSSSRLYNWLLRHKLFGKTIRAYLEHRAVRRRTRNAALAILWTSLAVSAWLVDVFWVCLALLAVGIGVSAHLLSLRVLVEPDSKRDQPRNEADPCVFGSEPVPQDPKPI